MSKQYIVSDGSHILIKFLGQREWALSADNRKAYHFDTKAEAVFVRDEYESYKNYFAIWNRDTSTVKEVPHE